MVFSTKRLMAVAAITLAAAGAAQAQGPRMGMPTPQQMKQMRDQQKAQFYKELGVTPAQRTKLDTIENRYMPQFMRIQKKYMAQIQPRMAAVRKKYPNPTPQQQQQAMRELQPIVMKVQQQAIAEVKPLADKMEKESMAVLTPAQRTKYKKIQAARRSGGPGGGPGVRR